jgi:hypothetical protein
MPIRPRLATLLALFVLTTSRLAAQAELFDFSERRGMMATVGVGVGTAGVSCIPKCSADRQSGPVLLVRAGGRLASQISLVLEGDVYRREFATPEGPARWSMSWYMIGGIWYPREEESFFVNFGIGLAVGRNDIEFPTVGYQPLNSSDLGGTIGIGRDFSFRDHFAVTAFAQYLMSGRSQALIGRANSGAKVGMDLIHAGLALSIF